MLSKEILENYEKEVQYQKHMLENLGRWFTLLFVLAGIGVVLTYFFHQQIFPLFLLGLFLLILGILGMIVFGYGIYKGRANLNKLIHLVEFNLAKQ